MPGAVPLPPIACLIFGVVLIAASGIYLLILVFGYKWWRERFHST